MTAYVVSKWGVRALARQLQIENRDLPGVHVCIVSPGGVDTPIYTQGASLVGSPGRPPPPVASPEKVAASTLALFTSPRPRVQVGASNNPAMAAFALLPAPWDVGAARFLPLVGLDRTVHRRDPEGNVLRPRPRGDRLHGGQGNAIVGIARNVWAVMRGSTGRPE